MKLRYEKKFYTDSKYFSDIECFLLSNQIGFRRIYETRLINSIYFDDLDLINYCNSIDGLPNREKYRLRWYGKEKIIKPNFEIKQKFGKVGNKLIFELNSLDLNKPLNKLEIFSQIKNKFSNKDNYYFFTFIPIIYIFYERSYFISMNNNLRITLDRDINYSYLLGKNLIKTNPSIKDNSIVIELKYSRKDESIDIMSRKSFPLYASKFSKYTNAVEKLFV